MPKTVELTIEIEVQKVSCPGVWLCQDGRVSLTIFALGTSFQTCLLPPVFPLAFRDVFYFCKKFKEGCALNNICCLLKDETIYCELVQWCNDCVSGECVMLAQYLGSLNDVLFPPNLCSTDGVDLLTRRTKHFPGILSPKIEIATKLRIDEIRSPGSSSKDRERSYLEGQGARGQDSESGRHRQACHSAQYHRNRCNKSIKRSRSRARSPSPKTYASRSYCSLNTGEDCASCPLPHCTPHSARTRPCDYSVYSADAVCSRAAADHYCDGQDTSNETEDANPLLNNFEKTLIESRYIAAESKNEAPKKKSQYATKLTPCVCEICARYHEIFHKHS